MKKRLIALFFSLVLLCSAVPALSEVITIGTVVYSGWTINAANFPDATFRAYLSSLSKTPDRDFLRDSVEINDLKTINVSKCDNPQYEWKKGKIKSLDGISKLKYVRTLWAGGNNLSGTNLNEILNHPSLTVASLTEAGLSGSVTVGSSSHLEKQDFTNNKLTGIKVQAPRLDEIYVGGNQLTSLDLSGSPSLKQIHCYSNPLKTLTVTGNSALESLDCSKCRLNSLNLSKNPALQGVSCWSNNLKTLDVSHNPGLSWLDCSVNKITVLDVSKCPALVALVKGNKRQQNKAEKLDYFYANGNQLLIDPWVKVIAGDFVSAGTEKVPDSIAQEEKEKKPFTKKISGIKFKLDPAKKTAEFIGPVDKKTTKAGVPDTIKAGGVTYKVTKIAAKAFSGCTKLTKVTIGKNVTEIGASAFQGCSALKSVTIPSKVSKIGASAFYKCKKLAEINVKTRKLKSGSVGKNAFKGISSKAVFKCPSKTLRTTYKKLFTAAGAPKKAKYK